MKNCKTDLDVTTSETMEARRLIQPNARVEKPDPNSDNAATRLIVELPGVAQDDLEITLEDESLTIRGRTRAVNLETVPELRLSEFAADADYERSFRISSEVDTDGIQAHYEQGVLTLSLPRRQPNRRSIPLG